LRCSLVEDDRFVPVDENAVFKMAADSVGKDELLKVTAVSDHFLHTTAVTYADEILMDDGAGI